MKVLSLLLLFTSLAHAVSTNLGASLPLKVDASGNPSFSAAYTTDDDPDGASYMLTLSSNSTSATRLRWNFYVASIDSYLLEWSPLRSANLASIQLKSHDALLISKILSGQKKLNGVSELYFVLADENNNPIYNLSISQMCAQFPKTFRNMTDHRKCDQF
jgi:hypothetical protein